MLYIYKYIYTQSIGRGGDNLSEIRLLHHSFHADEVGFFPFSTLQYIHLRQTLFTIN